MGSGETEKGNPHLNYDNARFPIIGAAIQKRAGNARHDAVAWGYARAADMLGVDIIQNCEVTGVTRIDGKVTALETSRRQHSGEKSGVCGSREYFPTLADGRAWQIAHRNPLATGLHIRADKTLARSCGGVRCWWRTFLHITIG